MYDEQFMSRALALANSSAKLGEVPVGAVIVKDGKIIAEGMNRRESEKNALFHAETSAVYEACKKLGSWRLCGCEIYVTMEPCPMCAGAILNSRINEVYYGCKNPETGFCGSRFDLFTASGLNAPTVKGGCLENECAAVVKEFFTGIRKEKERNNKAMSISIIAAEGRNREIGGKNALLWRLPSDLKFFKSVTMGKSVIMGRKTFESLPKALPGRQNIVITRNSDFEATGAIVVSSPEEAFETATTPEVFIIGGESIYKEYIDKADKIYLTEVDFTSDEADAYFPEFDKTLFDKEIINEGTDNGLHYTHILFTRRKTE